MQINWILALVIMLLTTMWAFTYYSQTYGREESPIEKVKNLIADKIEEQLNIEGTEIPVRVNSSSSGYSIVSIMMNNPPNSTRTYQNNNQIDCESNSTHVFFNASLLEGVNYFTIKLSSLNEDKNCTSTFDKINITNSTLFANETIKVFSNVRINQMLAKSYSTFKSEIGSDRDFKIVITTQTGEINFGLNPPTKSEVFVEERKTKIWETGESASLRVLIW